MLGTVLQIAVWAKAAGALAAAVVALAAAFGISKLAQFTMEASARQPEIAGGLRTTAIIIGALIAQLVVALDALQCLILGQAQLFHQLFQSVGGEGVDEVGEHAHMILGGFM